LKFTFDFSEKKFADLPLSRIANEARNKVTDLNELDRPIARELSREIVKAEASEQKSFRAREEKRIEKCGEITRRNDIFNREKWEGFSEDERRQLIESYVEDMTEALELKHIRPRVVFRDDWKPFRRGAFDSAGRLEINADVLRDPEKRGDAIETVCHEMRHAFQYEAIADGARLGVPETVRREWRNNFDAYTRAEHNFPAYYNQPVEKDARAFANAVVKRSNGHG
jgi:hypothetical protein